MARPNPYRDPVPYNRVRLGGQLVLAVLTEFSGIKVEWGWKVDKSKSTSGGAAKYIGAKLIGGEKGFTLKFKCAGEGPNALAAAAAAYDDLWAKYDLIKPIPGQGGGTTATAGQGQTSGVGSPPASTTSSASSAFTAAESSFGAGGTTKADPDPGPRPPTLPIEFAPCANVGIFAVAGASWEETYDAKDLSWDITIGLIADTATTPAGAGVMAAPKPGGSGGATGGGTATGSPNAAAQSEAAGT